MQTKTVGVISAAMAGALLFTGVAISAAIAISATPAFAASYTNYLNAGTSLTQVTVYGCRTTSICSCSKRTVIWFFTPSQAINHSGRATPLVTVVQLRSSKVTAILSSTHPVTSRSGPVGRAAIRTLFYSCKMMRTLLFGAPGNIPSSGGRRTQKKYHPAVPTVVEVRLLSMTRQISTMFLCLALNGRSRQ